jgi:hypothetical protein
LKRSNQLAVESAVIASVLIMLTLGGSVATTTVPRSFVALQDPGTVKVSHDLNALAVYYNTTLTQIGAGGFANASFLLETFRFVNIPPSVNATAQLANSDLSTVNATAANATRVFQEADLAIKAKEYVNATAFVEEGCALAQQANRSLYDFQGPQTARFEAESVPVSQYTKGSAAVAAEVRSLLAECDSYRQQVNFNGLVLLIGSPQTATETGGTVDLVGNLTFRGSAVAGDEVLFYIDGSYFGTLTTTPGGTLSGTLRIPFIYSPTASVQALVLPSASLNLGGAASNTLIFEILFNQTAIVVGDPPAVLPTFAFSVVGNLTTVSGAPLPDAPVSVTFFNESQTLYTDAMGVFSTRLTVPADASDGVYDVYARFAPQGVLGPSFNFTSIQVVHLPLVLTVVSPSLSFAGFSTTLSGTATANGSGLADARITVDSPWGSASAMTDSSGVFQVSLPVSPVEFAFSRNVTFTAVAVQPYVSRGAAGATLGLFNVLVVILPGAGIGIIGYEAEKLGAFERLRNRTRRRQASVLEEVQVVPEAAVAVADVPGAPELLGIYRSAITLATANLQVRFRPSMTIREARSLVGTKLSGPPLDAFSDIMSTVEDFLYAKSFDESRLAAAKTRLSELEALWK